MDAGTEHPTHARARTHSTPITTTHDSRPLWQEHPVHTTRQQQCPLPPTLPACAAGPTQHDEAPVYHTAVLWHTQHSTAQYVWQVNINAY